MPFRLSKERFSRAIRENRIEDKPSTWGQMVTSDLLVDAPEEKWLDDETLCQ